MAKKKAAKKKSAPKHSKARRIPRQDVLPGIGDTKIAAIENAALDYAEIRDERQVLTTKEVDLKKRLLDLMHNKGLKEYKRNGISVKVVMEEENVKVRVRAEEDLDEAAPAETVEVGEQTEESEAQPD
jgi:alpha-galactosidase